ncbi:hypothetical protein [Dactylosporangium sp. NPDC006015]
MEELSPAFARRVDGERGDTLLAGLDADAAAFVAEILAEIFADLG